MKVALLISGYYRSFKTNLFNIKSCILNKFECVDVYIHVTNDEINEDKYLNLLKEEDYNFIEKELNPICILKENNFQYVNEKLQNNTFNSWGKYFKLNEIKKINEKINGTYDLVIKSRPDLFLNTIDCFDHFVDSTVVYIPKESLIDKQKLNKITDPTVCDVFAYGTSNVMDLYFNIYNNLTSLCRQYGNVSETLLYFYLNSCCPYEERNIDYSIILSQCNTFAVCGDSASGKSTLSNLLKNNFSNSFTLECDRYHKWERGDLAWKNLTHLNPESNYIAKMNKDIFDLKIGKTVYQVDYDHKTGKFTNKQQIKNSDTIIVCGLHSLYAPGHVYNLKIFMDTDEELKTKWKIERDTKKRGYTTEEVLKTIKKRKDDFVQYILPQKEDANIIVRFFPLNTNIEKIGLELLVSKNFAINTFHKILNNNDIKYEFEIKQSMYSFTFKEYKFIKNLNFYTNNSFYDYIILFILESGFTL